jgi:hypothetical protein
MPRADDGAPGRRQARRMHTIAHVPTAAAPDASGRPLTRWSRRAAVAAPVAAVIAVVVGAPLYADDLSEAAATGRFVVANAITLGVLLLLGLALAGLYMEGERRLGTLGHAGFLAALAGVVLAAGGAWDSLFAVPWLADESPAVLDEPTGGSLLAGFVLSYLVLMIGHVLFASAWLRAGLASRGASIALIAGAALAIVPAPTALRLLPLAIGVALVARSAGRPR